MVRAPFLCLLAILCASPSVFAQVVAPDQGAASAFPSDPAAWINSPPLTKDVLAGKGVFLWFYEEQCPRCREKWPEMMALAKKFEGQPVIFIAVNSGNPRPAVEQYVRQVKLNWPVLVDPNRQFEQTVLGQQISLNNIYQPVAINGEGEKRQGNWKNIEESAQQALKGASWKIDPAGIPQDLHPAWLAIEMGDYKTAGAHLSKARAGKQAVEHKEVLENLNAIALNAFEDAFVAAKELEAAGSKRAALQALYALNDRFKGYELPADFKELGKKLAADPEIKKESAAAVQLETAKKAIAVGSEVAKKRAATILKKVIADVPGTETAKEAETLLQQAGGK